jgi:hypothetical protein
LLVLRWVFSFAGVCFFVTFALIQKDHLIIFCGFLLRYFGTQAFRGIVTLSLAKGFAGRSNQIDLGF